MGLVRCLLRNQKALSGYDTNDLIPNSKVYIEKGMSKPDAEMRVVNEKMREISLDRANIIDQIMVEYKRLDPKGYAELAAQLPQNDSAIQNADQSNDAAENNDASSQSTGDMFSQSNIDKETKNAETEKAQSPKPKPTKPTKTKSTPLADTSDVGGELIANVRQKGITVADLEKATNGTEMLAMAKKAKVWERPKYEELIEQGVKPAFAHIVKQIYDSIPNQPKYKDDKYIKAYVEGIEVLRESVSGFLANFDAQNSYVQRVMKDITRQRSGSFTIGIDEILKQGESDPANAIFEKVFPKNEAGARWGNKNLDGNVRAVALGNKLIKQIQLSTNDLAKALRAVTEGWPAKQELWQKSYLVQENDQGKFELRKKNGSRSSLRETFESKDQAEDAAR